MILDNLERDLEKLSTDGQALIFTQDEFKQKMALSKAQADQFN